MSIGNVKIRVVEGIERILWECPVISKRGLEEINAQKELELEAIKTTNILRLVRKLQDLE